MQNGLPHELNRIFTFKELLILEYVLENTRDIPYKESDAPVYEMLYVIREAINDIDGYGIMRLWFEGGEPTNPDTTVMYE
jgi:hypothetical protein